jgi:hypothetical protein
MVFVNVQGINDNKNALYFAASTGEYYILE